MRYEVDYVHDHIHSCTQREEVQARSFRKKGYNESSKTSLVRDRLRQAKTLCLKRRQFFPRTRESQMEIDNETILSPPSTIQRETTITPGYPGSPGDMFRDIEVRHKFPTQTHSARGRETYKPIKAHFKKSKENLDLSFSHEPLH